MVKTDPYPYCKKAAVNGLEALSLDDNSAPCQMFRKGLEGVNPRGLAFFFKGTLEQEEAMHNAIVEAIQHLGIV